MKRPSFSERRYAVDGRVNGRSDLYISATGETFPWFLVDLGSSEKIKAIKFITRQKIYVADRFISIAVS